MTDYDTIIPFLNNNHFYPGKTVVMKKNREVCEGLWLYCPPILKESKVNKLKELLGDGWKVDWFGNLQEIHIKKK